MIKKNDVKMIGCLLLGCCMLAMFTGCNTQEQQTLSFSEMSISPETANVSFSEMRTSTENETLTELTDKAIDEEKIFDEIALQEDESREQTDSFRLMYQGKMSDIVIELRHCDCIYNENDIQIYSHYVLNPESLSFGQYVLYIQTPQEQVQFYPVKDWRIDSEDKWLYTKSVDDDGIEHIQGIPFSVQADSILDFQKALLNTSQAEQMLCDAYNKTKQITPESAQTIFSNVTVELTEIESGVHLLKGNAGGVERSTGRRYYVDWQFCASDGKLKIKPCTLKQYDPEKDKAAFDKCNELFDQIERGDWSSVKPKDGLEYLWGAGNENWLRMDVNGDGMPELINGFTIEELPEYKFDTKISISFIFAYQDGGIELVYVDVNDGMEFLSITRNGRLVYEWGVSGGPRTMILRLCQFDLKWNKEYFDTLVRYEFLEEGGIFSEYYHEYYPDTYGVNGAGVYYIRERRKTENELQENEDGKYVVREYLTKEQFLKAYEEMTGWNFYKAETMYDETEF
ncbi:MAG: hypothetical protein K2N73_15440 [Lachnospiraceae bacterium]|nr:hypothetical protein [Lachnospiraceae bacterium]